jgi:hypothetical protein
MAALMIREIVRMAIMTFWALIEHSWEISAF